MADFTGLILQPNGSYLSENGRIIWKSWGDYTNSLKNNSKTKNNEKRIK